MPDGWEYDNLLNPLVDDAYEDGYSNLDESSFGFPGWWSLSGGWHFVVVAVVCVVVSLVVSALIVAGSHGGRGPVGVLGRCAVCLVEVLEGEDVERCPVCGVIGHRDHFLEWLKARGCAPTVRAG